MKLAEAVTQELDNREALLSEKQHDTFGPVREQWSFYQEVFGNLEVRDRFSCPGRNMIVFLTSNALIQITPGTGSSAMVVHLLRDFERIDVSDDSRLNRSRPSFKVSINQHKVGQHQPMLQWNASLDESGGVRDEEYAELKRLTSTLATLINGQ